MATKITPPRSITVPLWNEKMWKPTGELLARGEQIVVYPRAKKRHVFYYVNNQSLFWLCTFIPFTPRKHIRPGKKQQAMWIMSYCALYGVIEC